MKPSGLTAVYATAVTHCFILKRNNAYLMVIPCIDAAFLTLKLEGCPFITHLGHCDVLPQL